MTHVSNLARHTPRDRKAFLVWDKDEELKRINDRTACDLIS